MSLKETETRTMTQQGNEDMKGKARERKRARMLVAAQTLGRVFNPAYYPLMGFFILFTCTYLSQLPWALNLMFLAVVYVFTVLLPRLGVYAYRLLARLTRRELLLRHHRIVSYGLHIFFYGLLLHCLRMVRIPTFMGDIIVISLLLQVLCTVVTPWWKVSVHAAGAGAVVGALVAYSAIFHFNPVGWLCLAILVCGLVGSSRMLLLRHTLGEVTGGTLIGIGCGLTGLWL